MIIEAITGKAVPQNMEALVHGRINFTDAFDGHVMYQDIVRFM
ncbi:MAG: hypothetical protein ACLVI9_02755 [Anaerostipes hadrus]